MFALSNRRRTNLSLALIGVLAALPLAAIQAKEKQMVTVAYTLAPNKPLPSHIKAVAVIDSGVRSDEEKHTYRENKWSDIAADLMEAMLNSQPMAQGPSLTVVNRGNTKQILAEKDMQLAGIVEGDAATEAGKLLAVQGLIMSRINIHIDVQKSRKTTIDWMKLLGGGGQHEAARPTRYRTIPGERGDRRRRAYREPAPGFGGGPGLPIRDVEQISRDLTVQCSFSLVDVATGETLLQYTPPVMQKKDKKSPNFLFGRYVDEGALDPVDHFIGELVEQGARDFISMMAPVQVQYTYEIVGRGDDGEKAIRALRADDYASALAFLEKEYRHKSDKPETVFAMGVVSELVGDYDRALSYYRKVVSMEDVDDDDLPTYMSAKDRLTHHLPRIARPEGSPEPRRSEMRSPMDNSDRRGRGDRRRDRDRDEDDDD